MAKSKYESHVAPRSEEIKDWARNSAVAGANEQTGGGGKKTYGEKTAASLEKGVKGLIAYSSIKGTAEQLINTEVGRIELRTGAAEYQQRIQSAVNIGMSAISSAGSVLVGAATGNLPLVLIGLATKGIQTAISVYQKQVQLNLQKADENISIGLVSRRASTGARRQ